MAKGLAEEIPRITLLTPDKKLIWAEPARSPKAEDGDHAVTIAIDILLEMFKEVLKLMETAVNVKYLLSEVDGSYPKYPKKQEILAEAL